MRVSQKNLHNSGITQKRRKLEERKRKRTTEKEKQVTEKEGKRHMEKQSRKVFSPFVLRFSAHTQG